jgi:hypothetical protein
MAVIFTGLDERTILLHNKIDYDREKIYDTGTDCF